MVNGQTHMAFIQYITSNITYSRLQRCSQALDGHTESLQRARLQMFQLCALVLQPHPPKLTILRVHSHQLLLKKNSNQVLTTANGLSPSIALTSSLSICAFAALCRGSSRSYSSSGRLINKRGTERTSLSSSCWSRYCCSCSTSSVYAGW
jgi:hypothetical protein